MADKNILFVHRVDKTNIGDYVSSPATYFEFPNCKTEVADILTVEKSNLLDRNIILGGGGLLDDFFSTAINHITSQGGSKKLIAWGLGQQMDTGRWLTNYKQFPYLDYLEKFDLIGIRDFNFPFRWVPCVSCMSTQFDKPQKVKHEFVVYSHKQRIIPIDRFPHTTNSGNNFEEVLNFLASGETIITSSYHGVYWGLLLGRKVIAFPFNSKFYTMKYSVPKAPPAWKKKRQTLTLFSNKSIPNTYSYKNKIDFKKLTKGATSFPDALAECRQANLDFYHDVLRAMD